MRMTSTFKERIIFALKEGKVASLIRVTIRDGANDLHKSVLEVRCISRPLERGIKREGDDFKEGDCGLGVMAL